jgi:hypothetical protein
MTLERVRRFVFTVAAVALFLATVMPSIDVSANATDTAPTVIMAAMDGIDCPDGDTSRGNMVGCVQAICMGFAVIIDGECFDVSAMRPAYTVATIARPDGFKSAPSTPPI